MKRRYRDSWSWVGLVWLALVALVALISLCRPDGSPPDRSPFGPQRRSTRPDQRPQYPTGANQGYRPDPDGTRQFLRSLAKPTLREAAPALFAAGGDEPVLLYRALYKAYASYAHGGSWVVGRQGIGDCLSWGYAHGAEHLSAVMWTLGTSSQWYPVATEAIYGGSRVEALGKTQAGYQDGSYGAAGAKWCMQWGLVYRQPYDTVDLATYSAERAKDWGNWGCGGQDDGGRLDAIAKQHPIRNVALVTTFNEAAAAIRNGYPVVVCIVQCLRIIYFAV
jgi:hypothetical protein